MTYNIHKGFTSANLKFVLRELRATIQDVEADLVFLQEVIGEHQGHGKRISSWPVLSQFDFLAEKIWPHVTYGKNAIYAAGHHGNAILSKHPFTFSENIDVSHSRLERRGLLHAVINIPGKTPLHVICLHFALLESWRQPQIDRLCERINSHVPLDAPLIVAGDFNDWRERATEQLQQNLNLKEAFRQVHGSHARTFPVWLPVLKLDRVYCRGLDINNAICLTQGRWKTLSDHAALCVDFNF